MGIFDTKNHDNFGEVVDEEVKGMNNEETSETGLADSGNCKHETLKWVISNVSGFCAGYVAKKTLAKYVPVPGGLVGKIIWWVGCSAVVTTVDYLVTDQIKRCCDEYEDMIYKFKITIVKEDPENA